MLGLLVLTACSETGPARREPPGDDRAPAFTPLIVDEAGEVEGPEGGRIRYLRRGQGPGADRRAVLIVDGLNLIEPLGRALEAVADVVYLVGVERDGDAPAPPRSAVGRVHIDRIEALRVHLSLPRITLVGHSHGALFALEYALAYPDQVDRLVVIDGLYDHGSAIREHLAVLLDHLRQQDAAGNATVVTELQRIVKLDRFGLLDFLRSFEARLYLTKAKQLVSVRQGMERTGAIMRELESRFPAREAPAPASGGGDKMLEAVLPGVRGMNLINYTVIDASPKISAPVLLVQGRHDEHTGMAAARALDAALPHGKLHVLEQSGHFPTFEEPEQTSRVVLEFMGFPDPPPPTAELVPAGWQPSFPPPGLSSGQAASEATEWWTKGPVEGEVFGLYAGLCDAIAARQIPAEAWEQSGVSITEVAAFETQVCQRLEPRFPGHPDRPGRATQGP